MDSVAEIWRAIPGHEWYEASNLGQIRSLDRIIVTSVNPHGRRVKGRILRPSKRSKYFSVTIAGTSFYIHQLIAITFIGPIPDGMEVNHDDGIKSNNRLDNLEITTPGGNIRHAFATGLATPRRGEAHGQSKLTDEDIRRIQEITGMSQRAMAAKFGVSQSVIWAVRTGKIWKHVSKAVALGNQQCH